MDPWDLTRLFEMWACSRQKSELPFPAILPLTVSHRTLRCHGTRDVGWTPGRVCVPDLEWLEYVSTESIVASHSPITLPESITRQQNVTMNYVNYEDAIVERFKVKLVGWTFKQFVSPTDINTVQDVRELRNALKNGACHWVQLSPQALKDHVAAVDERRKQGEVVGKKRKERNDKGVARTRKRRSVTDENNPAGTSQPAKKRKTNSQKLAKSIPPKSKAFVDDDDEDSATEDVTTAM